MYGQLYIYALLTSLKILFVYGAMQEGMILFWLRRVIEWLTEPLPIKVYLWLRKPLSSCLFCMSSVWGFFFSMNVASFSWEYISFLFVVAGINYLIQIFINGQEIQTQEDSQNSHDVT